MSIREDGVKLLRSAASIPHHHRECVVSVRRALAAVDYMRVAKRGPVPKLSAAEDGEEVRTISMRMMYLQLADLCEQPIPPRSKKRLSEERALARWCTC